MWFYTATTTAPTTQAPTTQREIWIHCHFFNYSMLSHLEATTVQREFQHYRAKTFYEVKRPL